MERPIYLLESVDSTNDLALDAARDGAEHGATWVADQQRSGRGRRESGGDRRAWFSPAGSNIYLSTVVRPGLQSSEASKITVAVGLSVAAALRRATGVDIWLKWPNDLLVGDRKLAGILTEGIFEAGEFRAAVVGIGLNINVTEADVPAELREVMTSLALETSTTFDRMSLAFTIRGAIVDAADRLAESGLRGFAAIAETVDRSHGRTVEIGTADKLQVARAHGIDLDSGGLRVEIDGLDSIVTTGEARLVLD